MGLTDQRTPFVSDVYINLSTSPRFVTITSMLEGEPFYATHTAEELIILVKDVIVGSSMLNMAACALRNLNEFDVHIQHMCQDPPLSEQLEALKEMTFGLTETELQFTAYTMAVKLSRRLYHMPENQREIPQSFIRPLTSNQLLDFVEKFAHRQVSVNPTSGVGHANLGWVAMERRNSKEAALHYRKAIDLADAAGNDIVSCTARIEYCGCNIIGTEDVDLVEMTQM
jgi:hypothetical protein